MHIVALAWMFVVLLAAVAEAASPQGSVLGALITLIFYGVIPLAIVLYLMGTPMRWAAPANARAKARAKARAAEGSVAQSQPSVASSERGAHESELSAADPDRGDHAAGDAVAPEREKP